jgi:peptidyl-prolyl cis-trans isomerase A (cyclophilin A)
MKAIRLFTPFGIIDVALDTERAPKTANHFLNLIRGNFLRDAVFYRIVRASGVKDVAPTIDIIQGGVGWERCVELPSVAHERTDETGLRHRDGAISLARSADKDATSEFFICIGDQPLLDAGAMQGPGEIGFAVFGHVTQGMDVVRAIQNQPANREPPGGDQRFVEQFLTDTIPIAKIDVL